MIPFLIIYIVLMVLVLHKVNDYARTEAQWDDSCIEMEIPIDHDRRWRTRATLVTLEWAIPYCMLMSAGQWLFGVPIEHTWWPPLIGLPGFGFAFSLIFRRKLNMLREKGRFYMSPSNRYDRFFIRWFPRSPGEAAEVVEIFGFGICMGLSAMLLYSQHA